MDKLIVGLISIGAALLLSFLTSLPVMLLWNGCLVDAVAGVAEITWLQAWGISILTSILFKETSVSFKK
jgi:hypothetical protein